jgi:ATP-dependent DNA ligase
VQLYAFDVVALNGDDLRSLPLSMRMLKRIPVILKHSLRERNSWRIRLGLVVG